MIKPGPGLVNLKSSESLRFGDRGCARYGSASFHVGLEVQHLDQSSVRSVFGHLESIEGSR